MKLTPNFTREEFACRCGCGIEKRPEYQANLKKTALMMEDIRKGCGNHRVNVHCGIRCVKHNADVGGEPNSLHLRGLAVDFDVESISPNRVADTCEHIPSVNGLGRYNTFTHADCRGYKARWDKRS